MKKSIIIVLSCFFMFSSCSTSENPIDPQKVKYLWHLVNVSGGVAGVNETFSLDTIVWAFNDADKTLVVENNNDDDTIEDALDSGIYDFDVIEGASGKTFLTINETEFGNFEISQSALTINQNITTTGTGSDGFIYTFQRTIELID
ncbi:hypothetical protein [Hwangdonia lutea]|uniref:Lipocalin-like domain-containing protein n=1 Tax=Hwangdonia lutea TaxID=3075823 RepID=A0AA97ENR8_9FLAO|nr:hypothetical protein [Hwangdonia sp. SCSIO 19198]WOD43820.1 hypothetical protein RNZ46_00835 [Hwangdonia sp. SCSIO 19198]